MRGNICISQSLVWDEARSGSKIRILQAPPIIPLGCLELPPVPLPNERSKPVLVVHPICPE